MIGIGLVYIFYRKPPTSSSSSSSSSPNSSSTSFQAANSGIASSGRPSRHQSAYISPFAATADQLVDEDLQTVIAQIERQERDMIRQEQDEAYNQSLKADREKQLKREEEQKRIEEEKRLEKEKLLRQERLHDSLTKLRSEITSKLPNEPSKEEVENNCSVKLVFKLPDGSRVHRLFRKNDKVKYIYWFIFSLDKAPLQFRLTTNFPKQDLPGRPPIPPDFKDAEVDEDDETHDDELYGLKRSGYGQNCDASLEDSGLGETQMIFVHDLDV